MKVCDESCCNHHATTHVTFSRAKASISNLATYYRRGGGGGMLPGARNRDQTML